MRCLCFSLLLIATTAWGQAFTPRRPFIGSLSPGQFSPRNIPNLIYWWVFTDIDTNSAVTSWPDRIQTNRWEQNGSSSTRPVNTSTGVTFTAASSQVLTGAVTFADGANSYSSTHYLLLSRSLPSGFGTVISLTGAHSMYYNDLGGGVLNLLYQYAAFYRSIVPTTPLGHFQDVVVMVDFTNSFTTCYTNGVLAASINGPTSGYYSWDKVGGIGGQYFSGAIKEIGIWSNTILSTLQISNLHQYVKDTYPDVTP